MTHKERLALIAAPFPAVVIHKSSYPWAGVLIEDLDPHDTGLAEIKREIKARINRWFRPAWSVKS